MEWIADPTALLGLGTLILLEIVLGIDNLIFIAILVDKLPPAQRNRARIIGLSLALLMRIAMLAGISWLQTLTAPVLTVLGSGLSVRDLILIAGGLFLLLKATTELHGRLEGMQGHSVSGSPTAVFGTRSCRSSYSTSCSLLTPSSQRSGWLTSCRSWSLP